MRASVGEQSSRGGKSLRTSDALYIVATPTRNVACNVVFWYMISKLSFFFHSLVQMSIVSAQKHTFTKKKFHIRTNSGCIGFPLASTYRFCEKKFHKKTCMFKK